MIYQPKADPPMAERKGLHNWEKKLLNLLNQFLKIT